MKSKIQVIVDENQEFRLKMLILMKFDGKYARCNGIVVLMCAKEKKDPRITY